jgi:hypothetical protein
MKSLIDLFEKHLRHDIARVEAQSCFVELFGEPSQSPRPKGRDATATDRLMESTSREAHLVGATPHGLGEIHHLRRHSL